MRETARKSFGWRTLAVATVLLVLAFVLVRFWTARAGQARPRMMAGGAEGLEVTHLPDGRIVYPRSLPGAGSDAPMALYVAQADGRQERRITFGDARDRAPAVLPDGRIVFRRHTLGARSPGKLFVINPDGTGFQLFCEPADGASIEGGPWLKDEQVLFVEDMLNGSGERLVAVSPRSPFGEREILAGGENRADVSRVSPATFGKLIQPAASAGPRATPLNLTSVVDERKSTGTLLCLDVRASRLPPVANAQPGTMRTLRVLAADGRLLGEAPVEVDGSFFIEVPADQPLHLELGGPDGVLAKDHSGFWVRPNENRGCIGCHEDPEIAPDNRVVLALRQAAAPAGTATGIP
jgi:hypothetical protein